MRFWALVVLWVAVASPLVQFYLIDGPLRDAGISFAGMLLLYAVFVGVLVIVIRKYCTYAIWAQVLLGIVGAVLLAIPMGFTYLGALGRAFKN